MEDIKIIEMTLEGDIVSGPGRSRSPAGGTLIAWAVTGAVLALAVLIIAVALWFVAMLLPVILAAGAIAYLLARYNRWRRHW